MGPLVLSSSSFQSFNDLFPMQSPVFDENFARVAPVRDYARQMNPWHIALQRLGIEFRFAAFRIELHSQALNESVVRMIAGQREDLSRGQSPFTGSAFDNDFLGRNLFDAGFKQRFHLPCLDSILDVGTHSILDSRTQILVAVHQCHPRTVSVEVKRRLRCGILSSDNYDILIPEGMSLGVIMRNVWQVFARDAQSIWQVVIACSHRDLLPAVVLRYSLLCFRDNGKVAVVPINS